MAAVTLVEATAVGGWSPTPGSALHLLVAGVPLTLLMDLLDPDGPDSWAILTTERYRNL